MQIILTKIEQMDRDKNHIQLVHIKSSSMYVHAEIVRKS
jgi:hypothetical protein